LKEGPLPHHFRNFLKKAISAFEIFSAVRNFNSATFLRNVTRNYISAYLQHHFFAVCNFQERLFYNCISALLQLMAEVQTRKVTELAFKI
jgi:hypothetical protein